MREFNNRQAEIARVLHDSEPADTACRKVCHNVASIFSTGSGEDLRLKTLN